MKITFHIDYGTNWGESIYLTGDIEELGKWQEELSVPMSYDNGTWTATIEVDSSKKEFKYSFLVKCDNVVSRKEWGSAHTFKSGKRIRSYEIFDKWRDQPSDKSFYSSMFTEAVFRRNKKEYEPVEVGGIQIRAFAPTVKPEEDLAIVGESQFLGGWNTDKALVMNDADYPEWSANIPSQMMILIWCLSLLR